MIRFWPILLLALVLILWRLWYLRVRGEGVESNAAQRRRWRFGLLGVMVLLLFAVALEAMNSRPQQGIYHPLQMQPDGTIQPATIRKGAP